LARADRGRIAQRQDPTDRIAVTRLEPGRPITERIIVSWGCGPNPIVLNHTHSGITPINSKMIPGISHPHTGPSPAGGLKAYWRKFHPNDMNSAGHSSPMNEGTRALSEAHP